MGPSGTNPNRFQKFTEVLRILKFSQYLLVIPEGQLVKGKEPKLQEDENADFVGADNADSTEEDWFVFLPKLKSI